MGDFTDQGETPMFLALSVLQVRERKEKLIYIQEMKKKRLASGKSVKNSRWVYNRQGVRVVNSKPPLSSVHKKLMNIPGN